MGKKVYAIKEGFDFKNNTKIKNKIVSSWNECLKYVKGVKGAKYKSFINRDEAEEFLNSANNMLKKGEDKYPLDELHAYVDGSFNNATEKYSYGCVMVKDDIIFYAENGASKDSKEKNLRQIPGELKGAVRAVEYAYENGYRKLVLFHDYEGIYHHAVGDWERKGDSSKKYFHVMQNFIKDKKIDIIFVKVDSHTGDIYNEIVDELAKFAANMTVTGVSQRLSKHKKIKVLNQKVKDKLMEICSSDNLELKGDGATQHILDLLEDDEKYNLEKIINNVTNLIEENGQEAYSYIKNLDENTKNQILFKLIKKNGCKKFLE